MGTIDISWFSLCVGLLLLAIPVYFFKFYKVQLIVPTLIAAARMVVQLLLIGFYLKYLFIWNNAFINLLWVVVMIVVATFTSTKRTGLKVKVMFIPVSVGFLATAMLVGLYFLLLVLRLPNPFSAQYFIPIMGIIMGNMLSSNVIALNAYFDSLQRESQMYYYLLGNGASRHEATAPFIRQAMTKAFSPCIANMAVMGIVALPGTMIGQILGGSAPGIAVKYQMMIIIITFAASMLSLVITILLSERYVFDNFGRLRDVRRRMSKRAIS
jgi:putative ABC transport system permease protein